MKQQFLKDIAGTIRLQVYDNNVKVVPSAANIQINKPDGSELVATTSATIDGTTGELTYVLSTANNATHDLNYVANWDYTYNSTVFYETQLYDIVKSILSISIIDDDIFRELPSLRKQNKQQSGTATSATSSTLVDTARLKHDDDFWNGGVIHIISGTGANQRRGITDFVQSSSTISVSPDWATTPDTTSKYLVVQSFTNKIEHAFKKIETMLYNKGKRHSLILESSQVEFPLLYRVVADICWDLHDEVDDKWFTLAQTYEQKFSDSFGQMKLEYDVDESGTIDDEEERQNPAELRILRS